MLVCYTMCCILYLTQNNITMCVWNAYSLTLIETNQYLWAIAYLLILTHQEIKAIKVINNLIII